MLNNVLTFIAKEGDFSTSSIAKKLKISETMVEDIKEQLKRMGYIEKIECDTEICEKCSCGCGKIRKLNKTTNWNITEKGKKIIDVAGGRL